MAVSTISGARAAPVRKCEQVVLILMALGKPKAAELLRHFSREELDEISNLASNLRESDGSSLRLAIVDFECSLAESLNFRGTADDIRGLLADARKSELTPIVTNEPIWERLEKQKPERIQQYLLDQHPQVMAYILSKLSAALVAEVLSGFLAAQRNDIVARLLGIKGVSLEFEQMIENALEADFFAGGQQIAHHGAVAELLNQLNAEYSQNIIGYLELHRPDDAVVLRKLLFQFDDLPFLPPKSLALVLDRVSTEQIVVALKGANPTIKEALLAVMTPRARRMVEAELQSGAPVNEKDIAGARRKVASTVVQLTSEGLIQGPSPAATNKAKVM